MVKIIYVAYDGAEYVVDVAEGATLMEGARDNGLPGIEADCGGACACATCHAYVDSGWAEKLPVLQDAERDMLDFAWEPDLSRSRLTCQIRVSDDMEGLRLHIPERQI